MSSQRPHADVPGMKLPAPRTPDHIRGVVDLRSVAMSYPGADVPVLQDVTLHAEPGQTVAIIGATGRGAADRLRGALSETGATLLVDGVDVRPGGSLLVATVPDGPIVLGLGGNPMAAMLGAALLARPVRAALLREAPRAAELLPLADANPDDRWRMLPVEPDGAGRSRRGPQGAVAGDEEKISAEDASTEGLIRYYREHREG